MYIISFKTIIKLIIFVFFQLIESTAVLKSTKLKSVTHFSNFTSTVFYTNIRFKFPFVKDLSKQVDHNQNLLDENKTLHNHYF